MAYSTRNDPRMARGLTLEKSLEQAEKEKARLRSMTTSKVAAERLKKIKTVQMRARNLRTYEDRIREFAAEFKADQKEAALRRSMRASDRAHKRNRGAIAGRRGTYDEDTNQTARYDKLNLDPGSNPTGGEFDENYRGTTGPGRFVPSEKSFSPEADRTMDQVMRGAVEQGPALPGCGWMRDGPGKWPGQGGVSYSEDGVSDGANKEKFAGPTPRDSWDSWGRANRQHLSREI